MRYLKKCRLLCCVYLLVAAIGTLALRKNKVDGGAMDIQGKANIGEVKKNGTVMNQASTNACSGNYNKTGGGGECPMDASTGSAVEQKEQKQDVEVEKVQKDVSNTKSTLDNIVIPEDAFESAKKLCEFVVIKGEEFKEFCKQSIFFKEIQFLKEKDPNLYAQIAGESYENENTSSFQVLKDEGDKKIVMEDDKHNPKISILFLFQKMCVGGIPLACTNILKVDNVFDVNQNEKLEEGNADKAQADDVEGEITGAVEQDGSQGVSESVTDLTEEDS
ncbi:rhoptry neck protein 12, putative [Plasmodium knowlesi strain H]|uniref:Rhoptry neck protein 12, putative n=3 Tax=Plasmodium knowlesi TaxID=5850 RepID=A0A5K1VA43_PLAKH|nr:rhoptry neck protein 12, putative [Plasmodium knowlesi strain H]OTN68275.1 putative Rhoptry neck protein 12 [Plasmodium knowlesi]CAA9987063.1 rhoptry neck protein 12, putative [Plasmodium knowlesi strain H]SBO23784.1 rhoptry neck protein 12, putative [Plasmodium knowlesi strain H]SBO25512.1 rhoptry neck protein 12, putative [Plasmodium knowlesi strain H]VVS76537.1 rhoptry neck protein 12, putative [Plasmodium knowlesi strain H]|eukprot:XP_002261686.1 hypothetical protein, conserved in Plasmodium species [Plasmodium knowlesi strain H]